MGVFAALLTDPSKAFDSITRDLIIAKRANGANSLKLVHNYLSNREAINSLVNLLHISRTPFPKSTSGRLFLEKRYESICDALRDLVPV